MGRINGVINELSRLLIWDPNRSEVRVSVRRLIRLGNFKADARYLVSALTELVVTKLWLLEMRTPRALPTPDMCDKIATAYTTSKSRHSERNGEPRSGARRTNSIKRQKLTT